MERNHETPASAGVRIAPSTEKTSEGEVTVEVVKSGHPDRRFGPVKKLGKDGCGY